jgi:hypothetical protein
MTLAELNRTRRIENLAIVFGFLALIVVAICRPYMEQPRPISGAARG